MSTSITEKNVVVKMNDDWDLKAINHPNSKFTKEQKITAVSTFVLTGSAKKASEASGIPYPDIRDMKTRSAWWDDAVAKVRKEKQDELDSAMTTTIHDALDQITDRIHGGDFKLDAKTGELHRVPMAGKELAVAAAVLFDKRSLIRGDATSISSKRQEPLKDIEDKLKEFAKATKGRKLNEG